MWCHSQHHVVNEKKSKRDEICVITIVKKCIEIYGIRPFSNFRVLWRPGGVSDCTTTRWMWRPPSLDELALRCYNPKKGSAPSWWSVLKHDCLTIMASTKKNRGVVRLTIEFACVAWNECLVKEGSLIVVLELWLSVKVVEDHSKG